MRPKLRSDVRYVPAGDGVQVFSAAGSFGLTGASVAPLLDQLVGQLDGTRTLESIVAGLPERHQRVVTKLVDTLVARRVAYDAAAVLPHRLQDWELARYPQEVAFAELAGGSGAHRFEQFRLARVLLVGAGGTLDALVGTMLQLGSRGCHVLTTAGGPASRARHRSQLAAGRCEDPLLELVDVPDPGRWGSVAEVRSWLAGYQAVLHCDDQPRPDRAALLNRAARAAGIPALHAIVLADQAWVGPSSTTATGDRGCWECGWRYLIGARGRSDPPSAQLRLADPVPARSAGVPPPLQSLVGAILAMAYFRLVTEAGAGDAATNRLIRVDLVTATAREHRFSRHPACASCPPAPPPPPTPLPATPLPGGTGRVRTDEDLSRAAAALHDPALGILLSIDEPDHRQLPLVVTVATVNDLSGSGAGPRTVTAAGPDHRRARQRAAVRALETAATLAYPAPTPASSAERTVAAGYCWAEAVGRGLLRHAGRLAAAGDQDSGAGPGRPLAAPLPDPVRQLVEAAEVLGGRLRLADQTGGSGLPVVAVRAAGRPPVLATALDLPDALTTALETAVSQLQTGTADPQSATVGVPPDLGDERWPDRLEWLTGWLADRGWRAVARPVRLAPPLAEQLPLLAEVTLVRQPRDPA